MSTRPAFIRPLIPSMIAQSPPKGDAWVHEVKLDGYRALITKTGDRARIFTRSGAECTERLPQMVEAFAKLPTISAVLDGELCFVGPDSCANFYALMREMRTSSPDESCLMFFAFDLLQENDVDLRALPLSERRRDLERLCRKARVPFLKLIEQFPDGQALFRYACEYDFEGTVSKRLVSRYASGPSRHWVKCRAPHWERDNAERYRLCEKPRKPPAPTERERALQRRKAELARLHERLTEPKLRPGVVDALRALGKSATARDRRIGELSPLPRTVHQTVSKSMEPARSKGPVASLDLDGGAVKGSPKNTSAARPNHRRRKQNMCASLDEQPLAGRAFLS